MRKVLQQRARKASVVISVDNFDETPSLILQRMRNAFGEGPRRPSTFSAEFVAQRRPSPPSGLGVDLDDEEELREEIMAQGGPMIEEEREFLREYPQLPFRPPTPPANSYFYTGVVDVRHL